MRNPRLIAAVLGVLALIAAVGLAAGGAPALGVIAALAGLALIASSLFRPVSRVARRRLILLFPAYAVVMLVVGAIAFGAVSPGAASATLILAAGGLVGWLVARRQSGKQQRALMYMGYIRD